MFGWTVCQNELHVRRWLQPRPRDFQACKPFNCENVTMHDVTHIFERKSGEQLLTCPNGETTMKAPAAKTEH
eukprot:2401875-Amphidinium_carterae.1